MMMTQTRTGEPGPTIRRRAMVAIPRLLSSDPFTASVAPLVSRIKSVKGCLALALWLCMALPGLSWSAPPNIVLIFADDWGWGDLSIRGTDWLHTPNIDRLAAEGLDFQQFNVLSPVCSPSRAALMTGRYPARYGIHQHFAAPSSNRARNMPDWLDPKAPSLPRILKEAGYRTGHFGKWHLTSNQTRGAPTPEAYGYDVAKVFNGGAEWPRARPQDTADNTVAFIRAHADGPFFVNVWLHESHTPHLPTRESLDRWKHLDPQRQVYSAVLTDGDIAVGRILDVLKEVGAEQNTLVIFSSDNGPESTGPRKEYSHRRGDSGFAAYGSYYSVGVTGGLRGRKRSLFEGGVRVPFLVRWPGNAPPGVKDNSTVFTALDLLPTLSAAAGISLPSQLEGDGESLLEALKGKPIRRTRPIFWQWTGKDAEPDWWPRLAVRDGDWKVLLADGGRRVTLHSLNEDRAEAVDVARDNPQIVEHLRRLALEWEVAVKRDAGLAAGGVDTETEERKPAAMAARNDMQERRARAFGRLDTNGNGLVTLEEFKARPKGSSNLERRFLRLDADADGNLTPQEFLATP